MGQSASSQLNPNSSSFFKIFQSQFKPIDLKNEIKTGQIYVNDANQEMVIEFPYRIFNHESDEPWLKSQTMIKKIQAPYIIDYYGSIEKQSSEMCSTSTIILSYFEYIPQNLEKEINHRKQHLERFSEKEIWYFLCSITQALYELKQKGYNHQDIRPATIYLKSNGQIKICPIGIIIDQENSINKFIIHKSETYLSPTLKKQLVQNQQPKIQWNLIDSYALGNTLLDLMVLNDIKQIDEQQILELQNQCYNHYSIQLIRIMELLMAESENQLIIDDIYYILKPYQNKINNFQDFVINYEQVKQNALPLNNTLKCKSVIESFPYRYSHLSNSQQHQRTQSEIIYETQQQQQQNPIQIETQQIKQQIQYQQTNNIESQKSQSIIYPQQNIIEQNKQVNQTMFSQQQSQFQIQDSNLAQQQLSVTNQQPKLIQKLLLQSQLIPSQQQQIETFPTTQISPINQITQTYNQTSPSIRNNPNVIIGPSPTILNQPIDSSTISTFKKQQQSTQIPLGPNPIQSTIPNIQIPIQRYPAQVNQVYEQISPKTEIQSRNIPQSVPNQIINGAIQTVNLPNRPIQQYNLPYPLINTSYQPNNQLQNLNTLNQPINKINYSQIPNSNFVTPIQDHKISNQPLKASSQIYYQPQQPIQIKQGTYDNFRPQYYNFDRIQNVLQDSEDLLQQINK